MTEPLKNALSLFERELYDEAMHAAQGVKSDAPTTARAAEIIALCKNRTGAAAEGLALLEYAHTLDSSNASIAYNLAVIANDLEQRDVAMLAYQACLRHDPDNVNALWNYSDLLRVEDHFSQALVLFRRMRRLIPDKWLADYYHRLGVTLSALDQTGEAVEAFEKSIQLQSAEPDVTQWEYSHLMLSLGEWQQGWRAYDHRFAAGHKTRVVCHDYPYQVWRGEPLEGKSLFVHGEQGLGDEIMFSQCLASIKDQCRQLIIACQPPLVRLLADSFPEAIVLPHRARRTPADVSDYDIDFQCALGSLPRWLRRSDADYALTEPAIKSNPELVQHFAERLKSMTPANRKKFKVGLMWGSNPAHGVTWGQRRATNKSIPIRYFLPLEQYEPSVTFISLQNIDGAYQAAHLPELDLLDFHRELATLSETAALIENLDLVISVDTSIAHLAGALGKPVWVCLMKRADWRWQSDSEKSIWYPSARLFRQPTQGDWQAVIARVSDELGSTVLST